MLQEVAEAEYLKIAQELSMFGVAYYEIANKKGTRLWLGVTALGLRIYRASQRRSPLLVFPWGDIRTVSYHNKKVA